MNEITVGTLVRFGSQSGTVTRVWDKPAGNPYITVKTADGRTFVRFAAECAQVHSCMTCNDTGRVLADVWQGTRITKRCPDCRDEA